MFFQITFRDIWTSRPEVFQNVTLMQLAAGSQIASGAMNVFNSASRLGQVFSGNAQTAQQSQATGILGQGQQVIGALTTTANTINSSAQVMKAAKARLVSLVNAARVQGINVNLMTGVAFPTRALAHDHPARAAALTARYNQQIQLVIFQVNAHDAQVKLSLAATAMDAVSFVMNATGMAPSSSDAPAQTASGLPTTTAPTPVASTTIEPRSALTGADPSRPGFGLAGAGDLTGAGPGDRSGLGGSRPAMLAGAGAIAPGAATALSGAGGAGGGGTAVVGRAGGAGGAMGMGAAGIGVGGRGDGQRDSARWKHLAEDEDVFATPDIPDTNDGVLA